LGVFDITENGFVCIEHAPGVSIEEIKAKTAGQLSIHPSIKEMNV
jgi:3-oxoacid CoA-transferase subunit B